MAVVRKSKNQLDSNDITRNLPTLQFSHALTEEEKNLMILRKRSHALTVAACANATYAVPILNETRFGINWIKSRSITYFKLD